MNSNQQLTQQEINNIIDIDFKTALQQYGEGRFLGIFLYGKANIGPVYDVKEVETITVFFPSIQDIALGLPISNTWVERVGGGRTLRVDIRAVASLMQDENKHIEDILFTKSSQLSSAYQKLFSKCKEYFNSVGVSSWYPITANGPFANWWSMLFEQYFQYCDGTQEKLFSSLTKTEEKALIYLLERIGEEGVISISEVIQDSKISRPIFNSLLEKLDRYKGAEIKNCGVKGTSIRFSDHVLSRFQIETI